LLLIKQQATRHNHFKRESIRLSKLQALANLELVHILLQESSQRQNDAHLYQALTEQHIGAQTLTEAQLRQGEREMEES